MRYSKTIWNVLLFAILLAIGAGFRASLVQHERRRGMDMETFWKRKVLAAGPREVVVAGDSRAYRGISPEDLAAGLGTHPGQVFNFGFRGCGWTEIYLEQLQALEAQTLVLTLTPNSFLPETLAQNGHLRALEDYGKFGKSAFARFRDRFDAPLEALAQSRGLRPVEEQQLRRWLFVRQGRSYLETFHPNGWVATRVAPVKPDYYHAHYEKKFAASRVSPEAVDRFTGWLRARRAEGRRCVVLRMPIAEGLAEREAPSGLDWALLQQQVEAAGGTWIPVDPAAYQTFDGSHLPADEARRFSRWLGAEIRRLAADPPPF